MKQGLKDHQIRELVSAIAEDLRPMVSHGCLRQVVSQAVTRYLETNDLRLDRDGCINIVVNDSIPEDVVYVTQGR